MIDCQRQELTVYLAVPALFISSYAIGFIGCLDVMWPLVPQPLTSN
jgi:hypothetical protein